MCLGKWGQLGTGQKVAGNKRKKKEQCGGAKQCNRNKGTWGVCGKQASLCLDNHLDGTKLVWTNGLLFQSLCKR
ncbi:hypothetical protein Y1Q_0003214 [Alligator mississippiensis]|uniref:Uncharacterized protein n=1 Tax=Alligator mississippiensis TaxID=8496 RepID=A0A151MDX2_ALLMI|nr:hypothetical protein Y1Q_0003214 [Alligator mississippiensis]